MSKLLFAFLLAIGLVSATKVDKKFLDFQAFIAKCNKMYDTPEEMIEKFEVFKSNQKLIKKNSPKKFVYEFIMLYVTWNAQIVFYATLVIFVVIFGLIGLKIEIMVTIVATSFIGAFAAISGLSLLIGGFWM